MPKKLWLAAFGHHPNRDTTVGALRQIKECGFVAALGASRTLSAALRENGIPFTDLDVLYKPGIDRSSIYGEIADHVISLLSNHDSVAYVTQGHPLLYEETSRRLLHYCATSSTLVQCLPAVSFVDLVMSELNLPIKVGYQVIEATSFVDRNLVVNPHLVLFVAQVGVFRRASASGHLPLEPQDIDDFVNHLLKFYPPDHTCILCDSIPSEEKFLSEFVYLSELASEAPFMSFGTTLAIPPLDS